MTAERDQVIADLKAARAELVTRRRATYGFVSENGVCLLGAIGVVTNRRFSRLSELSQWCVFESGRTGNRARNRTVRAAQPLTEQLAKFFESKHSGDRGIHLLWEYNDRPETTDQDVLDLFDKTLADLGGLA